jgi:hypothetical protein
LHGTWTRQAPVSFNLPSISELDPALPGRISLAAAGYHLTFGLDKLLLFSSLMVVLIVLATYLGRLIQWLALVGSARRGLSSRLQEAFQHRTISFRLEVSIRISKLPSRRSRKAWLDCQTRSRVK